MAPPKTVLDPQEIRDLYNGGLTVTQIARQMHTSLATLYAQWPADLPRRNKGPAGGRWIKPSMNPKEIADALFAIIEPDDLADVAITIMNQLDARYGHQRD